MTTGTMIRRGLWSTSHNATGRARQDVRPEQVSTSARTPLIAERASAALAHYRVEDAEPIVTFVLIHPQLVDLLEEAPAAIARQFPDTSLTLEVYDDPEEPVTTLVVGIVTMLAPADALEQLQLLDEAWWLDTRPGFREHALITLAYPA